MNSSRFPDERERDNEPVKLVPTKSDADVAAELKQEIIKASGPFCEIFDKVVAAGFAINFQIGVNWTGKNSITHLELFKKY